jgi:hypothetical protein
MGTIASLVPQDATTQKDLLANHVEILTKIRAYAIGVAQTDIHTILNPPPSWFGTLSENLKAAKEHAGIWTTVLEPAITATIPETIINISSRFDTGTSAILEILSNTKNKPNADNIQTIKDELAWISRHMHSEKDDIDGLQTTFKEFQVNADADLTNLTTGNNSIQRAELDDQKVINDLTADIATQNAEIAKDNAAILASGLAGGVGLFVGVAVLGLGAAATGPGAPIAMTIGAFIMVGSIAEMAAVISVYEAKLADAQNKLNEDTAELDEEKKQLASLTVMNTSITNLVNLNKDMSQSLADVANWWAIISKQLKNVIQDLDDSSDDMKESHWSDLALDITQAQKDWASFAGFASGMQITVTTIQNQVIDVKNPKAA